MSNTARRSQNGNTHLADENNSLACGTPATTVRVNHISPLESVVTCSRCRSLAGWRTIAGSYQKRASSGLDSSAWGANRGR
jgi:hypothetical protein